MISNKFHESYKFGSPYDLAQELGEKGITRLLEIVCNAYDMLLKNNSVQIGMTEDEITEELYTEILLIWSKARIETVVPINQKIDRTLAKDRGRPPTIDLCFRDRWVKKAFFGFECKLVAESNSRLCKEYIDNGLYRYLQGKYCATSSVGSLIGYVTLGSLVTIIQDIKTRVDKERIVKKMTLAHSIHEFKDHYISEHSREKGLSDFRVHHLFFYFARARQRVAKFFGLTRTCQ